MVCMHLENYSVYARGQMKLSITSYRSDTLGGMLSKHCHKVFECVESITTTTALHL